MSSKQVFVVGAGASAEYGLPIGKQLQTIISKLVDIRFKDGLNQSSGDQQIFNICAQISREDPELNVNKVLEAGHLIRDGILLTDSIDNFMDKHADNQFVRLLGKLAISKAILLAEHRSSLRLITDSGQNSLRFDQLLDTWLVELFRSLQRDVRLSNVEKLFENITFVIFNYDRCVEHFLFHAVQNAYGIPEAEAAAVVGRAKFLHPYGKIGCLPWQEAEGLPRIEFGAKSGPIRDSAEGIFTYTEQLSDAKVVDAIQEEIGAAELLTFLGFSYQSQNVSLISPKKASSAKTVIGTTYGISKYNGELLKSDVGRSIFHSRATAQFHFEDMKCHTILAEYSGAFR